MDGNLLPSISLKSTSSCVPITCLFPRKPDFFFFFLHLALCPSHATNSNGLLIPSHMSAFFFFFFLNPSPAPVDEGSDRVLPGRQEDSCG